MDCLEVLVHISTPATRANDNLYRSLTDAYVAFEPHQPQDSEVRDEALPQSQNIQPNCHSDTGVPITRSMDSYGSFPSHITSVDRSSDSNGNHGISSSQEDVSISRLERLERMQTEWREQRTPKPSFASRGQGTSAIFLPAEETTFIEDTQQAFLDIASQLVDNQSATSEDSGDSDMDEDADEFELGDGDSVEVTAIDLDRTSFMAPAGNIQAGPLPASPEPKNIKSSTLRYASRNVPPQDAGSKVSPRRPDGRHSIRQSLSVAAFERVIRAPSSQRSFASVNTHSRDTSQVGLDDPSHIINFDDLSSIARPPPPKITTVSPGTLPSQVTTYLDQLKQQNPGRYKPKKMTRVLEADERGHWRVDCRLWPKPIQHQFWTLVQKDVESGKLGWGVTFHRDAARMRLGLVRLYCWGEIVEHVWLALWVHSGGRICSTGAAWVDGGDVEVITIP